MEGECVQRFRRRRSKDRGDEVKPKDPLRYVAVASLRLLKKTGGLLRLVGDEKHREWPGKRQRPYGLHGLRSWIRTRTLVMSTSRQTLFKLSSPATNLEESFTKISPLMAATMRSSALLLLIQPNLARMSR